MHLGVQLAQSHREFASPCRFGEQALEHGSAPRTSEDEGRPALDAGQAEQLGRRDPGVADGTSGSSLELQLVLPESGAQDLRDPVVAEREDVGGPPGGEVRAEPFRRLDWTGGQRRAPERSSGSGRSGRSGGSSSPSTVTPSMEAHSSRYGSSICAGGLGRPVTSCSSPPSKPPTSCPADDRERRRGRVARSSSVIGPR
jgi:hypothetical protein